MDRGNTFSLTIMVIVMALLAVFVGYLLGNWLIQLVTGDATYHQAYDEEINREETVEDEPSSSLPSASNNLDNKSQTIEPEPSPNQEPEQKQSNSSTGSQSQQLGDVYVIQIGAFSNTDNARELKQKLENDGFQVVINSEGSLHKVQLAVNGEEEAENKKSTLQNLGYNVFVTH